MQLFNSHSSNGKTWTQQNFIDTYYGRLSFVGGPFPPRLALSIPISYFSLTLTSVRTSSSATGQTSRPGLASARRRPFRIRTLRTGTLIRPLSREPLRSAETRDMAHPFRMLCPGANLWIGLFQLMPCYCTSPFLSNDCVSQICTLWLVQIFFLLRAAAPENGDCCPKSSRV
jgi:hypothetical protein